MSRFALVEIEDGPRIRCYCEPGLAIHVGDQCIVEADNVLEAGRVAELEESDVAGCELEVLILEPFHFPGEFWRPGEFHLDFALLAIPPDRK